MRAPFFTFSPGEIQRHDFDSFFDQLTCVLPESKGLVVIMGEFDDLILNKEMRQQLASQSTDFHTIQQGVLFYEDWSHARRDLWLLLSMAEPRFVFGYSGPFVALLDLLRESYVQPQQEAEKLRAGVTHQGVADKEEFTAGLLAENFSPLLSNVLGKFTLFTRRCGERS